MREVLLEAGNTISVGDPRTMDYDHRLQQAVPFNPSLTHESDEVELFLIISELGVEEQQKIHRGQSHLKLA